MTICYEFGSFHLDPVRRLLLKSDERVPLTAKAFDLLLILARRHGQVVSKEDIINQMWPGSITAENSLRVTVRAVRKALGESVEDHQYIVTASGGYSFVAAVKEVSVDTERGAHREGKERATLTEEETHTTDSVVISAKLGSFLGGHTGYALAASSIYAAIYCSILFLEVSYEFDRYGTSTLKIAPLVFFWTIPSAVAGLVIDWKQTVRGRSNGLALCSLWFFCAGLILFAALFPFLPSVPVTRLRFQAWSAQAVYLKDVFYFVSLACLFLITPFHFVVAMQRELVERRWKNALALLTGSKLGIAPKGTIYLRPWVLGIALAVIVVYGLIVRGYVVDNLILSPHTRLFTMLFHIRMLFAFGLAAYCLAWYGRALNELKRECLAALA